jgi:hypothetical protein
MRVTYDKAAIVRGSCTTDEEMDPIRDRLIQKVQRAADM